MIVVPAMVSDSRIVPSAAATIATKEWVHLQCQASQTIAANVLVLVVPIGQHIVTHEF